MLRNLSISFSSMFGIYRLGHIFSSGVSVKSLLSFKSFLTSDRVERLRACSCRASVQGIQLIQLGCFDMTSPVFPRLLNCVFKIDFQRCN